MSKTFILNFGHKLAQPVLDALAPCEEIRVPYKADMQASPERVVQVNVDRMARFVEQNGGALDGTVPLLVVLPGFTEGAVLLVAEIAGRVGFFPRIIPLRRQEDGTYGLLFRHERGNDIQTKYIDLERVRNLARNRR